MMVNLKLNLAHSNGWSAELYVNNATDEEWVYELQTQTDGTYASPSLPRVAVTEKHYIADLELLAVLAGVAGR